MENALTRSQRLLMEQEYHHYETYCRRLYGEEFFDAAMDGFIVAVRRYDQLPSAVKAILPFEVVCKRKMKDFVWAQLQKVERRTKRASMTSIDALLEDRGYMLKSYANTCPSVEDDVDAKLLLASISTLLSRDELKMVILQADGYTRQEIAETLGISSTTLDRHLARVRNLVKQSDWSWGSVFF